MVLSLLIHLGHLSIIFNKLTKQNLAKDILFLVTFWLANSLNKERKPR